MLPLIPEGIDNDNNLIVDFKILFEHDVRASAMKSGQSLYVWKARRIQEMILEDKSKNTNNETFS